MKKANHFDKWESYKPISSSGLGIFRILFSIFSLITVLQATPQFNQILFLPDFVYQPVLSVAYFFKNPPSVYLIQTVNTILICSTVGMLFGYRTKWSALLFGILFIINSSFVFSYFLIGHTHYIPFLAIIFSFSDWGDYYSLDALSNKKVKSKNKNWNVLPFFSLIVAFAIFTSGFSKLIGGWLNFDYQAVHFYLIEKYTFFYDKNFFATEFLKIKSKAVWELLDYYIVLTEIAPICVLFYPRLFRISMFNLATFHLFVYLFLSIPFSFYPLIYLPFIADWKNSPLLKEIYKLFTLRQFSSYFIYLIMFFVLVISLIIHFTFSDDGGEMLVAQQGTILIISYLIALYFYIESIYLLRLKKRKT